METAKRWLIGFLGLDAMQAKIATLESENAVLFDKYDAMIRALGKQAAKSSVFERDNIPVSEPKRYVPIARRRAQAERESATVGTHEDQVRANNARAMEII